MVLQRSHGGSDASVEPCFLQRNSFPLGRDAGPGNTNSEGAADENGGGGGGIATGVGGRDEPADAARLLATCPRKARATLFRCCPQLIDESMQTSFSVLDVPSTLDAAQGLPDAIELVPFPRGF